MMEQERDQQGREDQPGHETNLNSEQVLGLSVGTQSADAHNDDVPTVWKVFGGAVFSIVFMLLITIFGYLINNLTNLQYSVNALNSDMVKKNEFNERITSMWGTLRQVDTLRDRLGAVEGRCPAIDALKEKLSGESQKVQTLEAQFKAEQEENRSQAKDIQSLRERMAVLEARKSE